VRTGAIRGLFALVVLAYIAVFVWFSPLLLQDYPNHLARAFVMADLLFRHGADFGQSYRFHFMLTPYVAGDLLLTLVVYLTGVKAAGVIWVILTFLSLPAAVYVYLRALRASTEVTLLMLFVSLYLSTDTFFVMGFLEFKLSIALTLVALAQVELLRQQWSGVRFGIFAALIVFTYLTHLAAIAFIGDLPFHTHHLRACLAPPGGNQLSPAWRSRCAGKPLGHGRNQDGAPLVGSRAIPACARFRRRGNVADVPVALHGW
jgi:hypothetical protein